MYARFSFLCRFRHPFASQYRCFHPRFLYSCPQCSQFPGVFDTPLAMFFLQLCEILKQLGPMLPNILILKLLKPPWPVRFRRHVQAVPLGVYPVRSVHRLPIGIHPAEVALPQFRNTFLQSQSLWPFVLVPWRLQGSYQTP